MIEDGLRLAEIGSRSDHWNIRAAPPRRGRDPPSECPRGAPAAGPGPPRAQVNEKLQQIFIALTLKAEQEEYVHEGIQWQEVKYFNNKVVCELIEAKRPPGLLLVLDDCCKRMHSRPGWQIDDAFRGDACSAQQRHRHFQPAKTGFVVKHYAGDVAYDTAGFAEANRDELRKDLTEILLASSDAGLRRLYAADAEARRQREADPRSRKGGSGPTAGRKIRDQCSELVAASVCAGTDQPRVASTPRPRREYFVKTGRDNRPLAF